MHTLAEALLEFESLSGDEVNTLLAGGALTRGGLTVSPENSVFGFKSAPKASSSDKNEEKGDLHAKNGSD